MHPQEAVGVQKYEQDDGQRRQKEDLPKDGANSYGWKQRARASGATKKWLTGNDGVQFLHFHNTSVVGSGERRTKSFKQP